MKKLFYLFIVILTVSCSKEQYNTRSVSLIIDDAPNFNENTLKIVEVLKKHNASATFYCIGEQMLNYPNTVIEILKNGNTIGNHSYNHPDFVQLSNKEIKLQIDNTEKIISNWTVSNNLFRLPYDAGTKDQKDYITKYLGYKIIKEDWNAGDWDNNKSLESMKEYYLNQLKNSSLESPKITFHLSDNSVLLLDWLLTELEKRQISVVRNYTL